MARAHIHRVTHDIIIPLILRQIPRWLNHTGRAVNHTGRLMWAWPALAVLSSLNRGGRWIQVLASAELLLPILAAPPRHFLTVLESREPSFPRRDAARSPIGDTNRDALCWRSCLYWAFTRDIAFYAIAICSAEVLLTVRSLFPRTPFCFSFRFSRRRRVIILRAWLLLTCILLNRFITMMLAVKQLFTVFRNYWHE